MVREMKSFLAKLITVCVLFLLLLETNAAIIELKGEELFRRPEAKNTEVPQKNSEKSDDQKSSLVQNVRSSKKSTSVSKPKVKLTTPSNLPTYLRPQGKALSSKDELLVRTLKSDYLPVGMPGPGSQMVAVIPHSLVAFLSEKVPVIARVRDKKYLGLVLIGFTRLEPNSKRIFVEFTELQKGEEGYKILASGFDFDGRPGISGTHHSREKEYFWGEFVSSFVAGYFESLVPKESTIFGTQIEKPSMDNAIKRGVSTGLMSSADRFKEKLKMAPEFTETQGPVPVKVIMVQGPKTAN
jgi:hypothetical protein